MKIQTMFMLVVVAVTMVEAGRSSLQYTRRNLPGKAAIFLPRMRNGRNSKTMEEGNIPAPVETEETEARTVENKDVSALLADLKEALAEVTNYDDNIEEVYNDLDDENPSAATQKDRLAKENKSKYNIEQHNFSLEEDSQRSQNSSVVNIQPQQPQQFYNNNNNQQQQYSNLQQQQYFQQQQQQQRYNNNNNNNQYGQQQQQGYNGNPVPRQITGRGGVLFNQFGDAMGPDASTDPDRNKYPDQSQLNPRQQEEATEEKKEDVRCIKKLMQVEETVYEEKVKCQHTFSEKCHDTFITDYVPTQEKKCETSFDKNCHITYKPMMFEEDVEICNEPLTKTCNNNTIGQGETVCNTHYETICETRYKEHEVKQDEPECEMVIEKKCKEVTIPVPNIQFRRRRQVGDPDVGGAPALTSGDLGPDVDVDLAEDTDSLVSIGEECEEWPVQKCTLQEKVVKKTTPNTACEKIPKEICAPSNCVVAPSKKHCRTETRALLQNIPTEECDLEPQEHCKMETVLVPRLIQQPNCIKVPKEVCVNERVNPKKVSRPVVKEWCYKPSDLKEPTSRLALSQFFNKN